jgi:hypothetical protein
MSLRGLSLTDGREMASSSGLCRLKRGNLTFLSTPRTAPAGFIRSLQGFGTMRRLSESLKRRLSVEITREDAGPGGA